MRQRWPWVDLRVSRRPWREAEIFVQSGAPRLNEPHVSRCWWASFERTERAWMAEGTACRPLSHRLASARLRGVKGALRRAPPALDPSPSGTPKHKPHGCPIPKWTRITQSPLSHTGTRSVNSARCSARKPLPSLKFPRRRLAMLQDRIRHEPQIARDEQTWFSSNRGGHNKSP